MKSQRNDVRNRVNDEEVEIRDLLADAALLRALAAACRYPTADARCEVAAMLAGVRAAQQERMAVVPWGDAFTGAESSWRAASQDTIEAEYVRLFLGAGPCPLHETAYGDGRRVAGRTVELADIAGFYRAFGFELSDEHRDLPDHLSAELEFASLLAVKEAYALCQGWPEPRAIAREARRDFLESHLGRWVGALGAALGEHTTDPAILAIAGLVCRVVEEQCGKVGVVPQLSEGRLPHDFMQDDSFECPLAAARRCGGDSAREGA